MDIKRHWIDQARHVPSPNHNQRPQPGEVSLIVIHSISLPPGEYGKGYIDQFFLNQLPVHEHPYFQSIQALCVSSHLLIERSGDLVQYVAFDKRAWHAGDSEFCGRRGCNDFSIGIELEGAEQQLFTEDQYQQLANVIKVLQQAYPKTKEHPVVGHCHISPGRKTDPGEAFDWSYLVRQGIRTWGSE